MKISLTTKTIETLEDGKGWLIEGIASTNENPETSQGFLFMPGAFNQAIQYWEEEEQALPLLLNHSVTTQLGRITALEYSADAELRFVASIPKGTQLTEETIVHLNAGNIRGVSVGVNFHIDDLTMAEDEGDLIQIHKCHLNEISLTPIPANREAILSGGSDGMTDDGKTINSFFSREDIVTQLKDVELKTRDLEKILKQNFGLSNKEAKTLISNAKTQQHATDRDDLEAKQAAEKEERDASELLSQIQNILK